MIELCGVCAKTLKKTDKRILCTICKNKVHIKCNLLTRENFKNINNADDYLCINSTDDKIPFSMLPENEFNLLVQFGITSINEEHDQLHVLSPAQNPHLKNINEILQRVSSEN